MGNRTDLVSLTRVCAVVRVYGTESRRKPWQRPDSTTSAATVEIAPMPDTATDLEALLSGLNDPQRQAVTYGEGPLLILAGAGSGKTRVLTHRIAYLIRDLGVPASAILAVTFTNKAAREMRERLARLVGKERLAELTVGTFHAFCARLLRREGPLVGIDRSYAIYDEADQRAVLRQAMTDTNASERIFAPGAVAAIISG